MAVLPQGIILQGYKALKETKGNGLIITPQRYYNATRGLI